MPKVIHTISKLLSGRVTGPALRPALLILGAVVISLLHINLAHAESDSGSLTITAEKSLTVTVPDSTNLSIHPTENGAFNTADINIVVNSNNRYGYNLNMTTATTSLTGNAPLSSGNYPVIESISSSGMTCTVETGTTCNFTKDKWGYKLSTDTTYSPIQANTNMLIKNNTNESTGTPETSTVTFGARLSNATPAGSYSTTLTFLATINNPTAVGGVSFEEAFDFADKQKYNGYYAMQDMDATICEYVKPQTNRADPATMTAGSLIDLRDGEIYTVGKTVNSECWMLDNLRLGASPLLQELTSDNTNLPAGSTYTLPSGGIYTAYAKEVSSYDAETGWVMGTLYEYPVVFAGTGQNLTSNTVLRYSICPAGWEMSNQGSTHSLDQLHAIYDDYSASDSTKLINSLHLPMAGYYNTHQNDYIQGGAQIWSNFALGTTGYAVGYKIYTNSYGRTNFPGFYGHSIRCVAQ